MKNKITFLICIIFIAIVLKLLTLSPKFVENFYSRKAYKVISGSIGRRLLQGTDRQVYSGGLQGRIPHTGRT